MKGNVTTRYSFAVSLGHSPSSPISSNSPTFYPPTYSIDPRLVWNALFSEKKKTTGNPSVPSSHSSYLWIQARQSTICIKPSFPQSRGFVPDTKSFDGWTSPTLFPSRVPGWIRRLATVRWGRHRSCHRCNWYKGLRNCGLCVLLRGERENVPSHREPLGRTRYNWGLYVHCWVRVVALDENWLYHKWYGRSNLQWS